jgi:hypothetical protein
MEQTLQRFMIDVGLGIAFLFKDRRRRLSPAAQSWHLLGCANVGACPRQHCPRYRAGMACYSL